MRLSSARQPLARRTGAKPGVTERTLPESSNASSHEHPLVDPQLPQT